jgi:heme A synthase
VGETADSTVREIEATRQRLDGEVRQLEAMLPAPVAWGKRIVGGIVGGGVVGTVFWFLVRRRKGKKEQRRLKDLDKRLSRVERKVDRLEDL